MIRMLFSPILINAFGGNTERAGSGTVFLCTRPLIHYVVPLTLALMLYMTDEQCNVVIQGVSWVWKSVQSNVGERH